MVETTTGQMVAAPANDFFSTPVIVHKQGFVLVVWLTSFTIIALGIAREITIAYIGVDTPLQDLRHFALDSENSLPVWHSSTLMTLSALLLWIISGKEKIKFRRRISLWSLLSMVFVAMSIDETSSFHEVLITPLQNSLGATGIFHFSWVIVAIPALMVFAIYLLPDLFRLPSIWITKFTASGVIYVTGALGMELVGGYFVSSLGWESTSYIIAATIEESLEIIGLALFVSFLFGYLNELVPGHRSDGP